MLSQVAQDMSLKQRQTTLGSSFGPIADKYAIARPTYPDSVIAALIHQNSNVLELGAGTGLLTQKVLSYAKSVVATDLALRMLEQLEERLPSATIAVARAENLPFDSESFDQIIVGQAAHWFDLETSLKEIARVVKPHGDLILIWNKRRNIMKWLDRFDEIVRATRHEKSEVAITETISSTGLFSPFTKLTSSFEHHLNVTNSEAFIESFSHVSTLAEADKTSVITSGSRLLKENADTNGVVAIPYICDAYYAKRSI